MIPQYEMDGLRGENSQAARHQQRKPFSFCKFVQYLTPGFEYLLLTNIHPDRLNLGFKESGLAP